MRPFPIPLTYSYIFITKYSPVRRNTAYLIFLYSSAFFLSIPRITHPAAAPTTTAAKYIKGFPMVGRTKIPPWGALRVQPNAMESPPAIAEPMIQEGITRSGSWAAKGMAPSVIKDRPIT